MFERSVNFNIEKTYSDLRVILLQRGCKIVSEEPKKHVLIEHGSLRGVSPKGAKKKITYDLFPHASGTRIVSRSSISSDWANLTLWGNIVAGFVSATFWWIASDISALMIDGTLGYWTWLAGAFGYPDFQRTAFMIELTKALSIVLVVTILLEILDVFVVCHKIDTFAAETLDELAQKQRNC